MSDAVALLLRGQNAHIVFNARTICNPKPRHYDIHLLCQI